jgi:2-methylfumaryl-CoA hydratase
MSKAHKGRFFEDFTLGQRLVHPTPRTVSSGDQALYQALYGGRVALFSSDAFAQRCGLPRAPLDPMLVFNVVFGKTVPDISMNAVANLGYAEGRFLALVYPGDTLTAVSEVIGLRETSNRKTGVVHVRTEGFNQDGRMVLSYVRWVMVRKRDALSPAPTPVAPTLAAQVLAQDLVAPPGLDFSGYDFGLAGARHAFEDYKVGERIDHIEGATVVEAEAQMATRLYQNPARIHFNPYARDDGRRLVYGGVVLSAARTLCFNGLENAGLVLALNGGRHVAPYFAGRTLFAWSQVIQAADLGPCGALRLRTIATVDHPCDDMPSLDDNGTSHPAIVLDMDYWVAVPKRAS